MTDPTDTALTPVAGGVPLGGDLDGSARDAEADDGALDATLSMTDEDWLEHALGDLHSSSWTVPNVEL